MNNSDGFIAESKWFCVIAVVVGVLASRKEVLVLVLPSA
jgi:hypothetical protein